MIRAILRRWWCGFPDLFPFRRSLQKIEVLLCPISGAIAGFAGWSGGTTRYGVIRFADVRAEFRAFGFFKPVSVLGSVDNYRAAMSVAVRYQLAA